MRKYMRANYIYLHNFISLYIFNSNYYYYIAFMQILWMIKRDVTKFKMHFE